MKISKDLKLLTTTQTELARTLSLTQPRVHQLIEEGIILKDDTGAVLVIESLKNYYKFKAYPLTDADKLSEDDGILNLDLERAKHERIRSQISQLKLDKMHGEVYDSKVVEMVMVEMCSNLRTQLLGIPSKIAPQIEGMTKEEIYDVLTKEIEDKLLELSEYQPKMFMDDEYVEAVDEIT